MPQRWREQARSEGLRWVNYEIEVNGRLRRVEVHRADSGFVVTVDGREWLVDAARVDAQTLSLLMRTAPTAVGPG